MLVPKYIKEKIKKSASYNEKAVRLNNDIRKWIHENVKEDEVESVIELLIDSMEQGVDLSDSFIDILERMDGS